MEELGIVPIRRLRSGAVEVSEGEVASFMRCADLDGDGRISRYEFHQWASRRASQVEASEVESASALSSVSRRAAD